MMNENVQTKLELLKVMKDLNGQGYRLNNEISALIKNILHDVNVTSGMINSSKNNDVIEKFKKSVNLESNVNGRLIVVDESDRGIGKTTSLINMANKLNLPIIVKGFSQARLMQSICQERKIKAPHFHSVTDIRGQRFPNGVLLEEGLSIQDILEIRKEFIVRGGYCNLEFLTK